MTEDIWELLYLVCLKLIELGVQEHVAWVDYNFHYMPIGYYFQDCNCSCYNEELLNQYCSNARLRYEREEVTYKHLMSVLRAASRVREYFHTETLSHEEPIEDYSVTIEGDEYTGFFVTNYHQPADNGGTTSPSPSEEPTATEGNGGNGGTSGTPGTTGGTGSNGGNGGTSGTSGTSGDGGTTKTLPQTGQLNWPVALFAVLGVIFVVVGIILVNTGRKKKHSEA